MLPWHFPQGILITERLCGNEATCEPGQFCSGHHRRQCLVNGLKELLRTEAGIYQPVAIFKIMMPMLLVEVRRRRSCADESSGAGSGGKKQDDGAYGEIETHHPGYLDSQDTFYVGTIKGVDRIY